MIIPLYIRFARDSLKYEVNWDDGGTTGRIIDYFNIALDKPPPENQLGIGLYLSKYFLTPKMQLRF